MKRKLFAIVACALVLGATSALAESKISGMFKLQGIMMSGDSDPTWTADGVRPSESDTVAAVDQRIRVKWTNAINEFVALTWFGELDTPWGTSGGKLGADGVNIETKNAFVDLKLPNTPVAARLGVQGVADLGLQNAYVNDDMAAAAFMLKLDPVAVNLILAKLYENNNNSSDDNNLYGVQAAFAATETLKFAAELYWNNVQAVQKANDADIYTIGVSGDMKFAGVGVDFFAAYQTGQYDDVTDVAALAASANAAMKVGPADLALRVIYYGNDDDAQDVNQFLPLQFADVDTNVNVNGSALEFVKDGQEIMLANGNKCNIGGTSDRVALDYAAYSGYGLFAAVLKAGVAIDKFAVKGSLGYYMALDDKTDGEATASREGTTVGTELDASVAYKLVDNATLSVRGAYAMLGDFFDNSATDVAGEDPDDLWRAVLALDVTF